MFSPNDTDAPDSSAAVHSPESKAPSGAFANTIETIFFPFAISGEIVIPVRFGEASETSVPGASRNEEEAQVRMFLDLCLDE
jgi:hypothetical protein